MLEKTLVLFLHDHCETSFFTCTIYIKTCVCKQHLGLLSKGSYMSRHRISRKRKAIWSCFVTHTHIIISIFFFHAATRHSYLTKICRCYPRGCRVRVSISSTTLFGISSINRINYFIVFKVLLLRRARGAFKQFYSCPQMSDKNSYKVLSTQRTNTIYVI